MALVAHTGGCLCGRLRFEASGLPSRVTHCHCFACRRQTGAVIATFAGFSTIDGFRWTQGKAAVYRSSATVKRSFCRRCGTPVAYEADRYDDEIYLAIGAFDEPDRLPAGSHVHVAQKVAWFETADDLPRFPGHQEKDAVAKREAEVGQLTREAKQRFDSVVRAAQPLPRPGS